MRKPVVAVVLPPREAFSPHAAGAIGLLVHRLATWPGAFETVVIGAPAPAAPFADIRFHAAQSSLIPARQARRYAGGVLRALRPLRPELIEVHNRPDVAMFLAARLPSIPVALTLHNDPIGMREATSPVERVRLFGRLAAVSTVSDYLRTRLLDGLVSPIPAPAVLPNCIDLRELPALPPERERLILFAGRIVADKGADSFVAACASALPSLPGWRAEMIGADRFGASSPETPFLRALRPRAAASGVALRGYLPHAEVLAAMSRAAIVVVPSRWPEPFGLTALEAMASGAALVCSGRGGLPEVAGDAGIVVDPDDPAAIATALVSLAGDPAQRDFLATLGRARAALFDLPAAVSARDAMRRAAVDGWSSARRAPI